MKLHVFSDESGYGTERFRALGFVFVPDSKVVAIRSELRLILARHSVSEIGWKEISGDSRKQKCGAEFLQECLRLACAGELTATALSWDLHDQRHALIGRDDIANRERMFHHGIVTSARRRAARTLRLYPDKTSVAIDYEAIKTYLGTTRREQHQPHLISLFEKDRSRFHIEALHELDSADEPLIQLADLLCGMGRSSLEWQDELRPWLSRRPAVHGQGTLFTPTPASPQGETSRGKQAKFSLIESFKSDCDKRKLGVSLSAGYLRTLNPKHPINFWLYEPQRLSDKAPTKSGRPSRV
jgi:hypothetical protein